MNIGNSLLGIYFLIGAAHGISHIMFCEPCRKTTGRMFFVFGEFIVRAIGWPMYPVSMVWDFFTGSRGEEISEEVTKQLQESVIRAIQEYERIQEGLKNEQSESNASP